MIPYQDFERLLEDAEMAQDMRAYDEAKKSIAEGEELIPSEITYALLDGANPVRVWREHRGLTQLDPILRWLVRSSSCVKLAPAPPSRFAVGSGLGCGSTRVPLGGAPKAKGD